MVNNHEHFLVFIDAADDAATYPLSSLAGITCAADATVKMWFNSSIAGGTGAGGTEADLVTLTTTADKDCLLYTSPRPRDGLLSRMPSSA